ncbi:MAG: PepSY domain-containing protein [Rhodomicrobiaceae bacterium]
MTKLIRLVPVLIFAALAKHALAAPPSNAKPLSEVLQAMEAGGNVAYFDEIEWDDDHWEIEYYTPDGSKVEVDVDPVSGQPRS